MAKVIFEFEDKELQPVIVENATENQSILDIAESNDVHLSHNCGAVCACSTCHVIILDGMDALTEISDREEDQIDGAINPTLDSRLGCQAEIVNEQAIIKVLIPDQKLIIAHEH